MSSVPFLIAQNIKVTNWLTPVWIISLGIALGFLIVLLMMAKIVVCQRIRGINSVTEKPSLRIGLGVVTGLVYLGLFLGFFYWRVGPEFFGPGIVLPLVFAVPICLLLGFGVWSLISRRMVGETWALFREGFLGWVNRICIVMTVFAVLGFVLAPFNGFGVIKFVDEPFAFMESFARLPFTGKSTKTIEIPPTEQFGDSVPLGISFNGQELQTLSFKTSQALVVATAPFGNEISPNDKFEVPVRDDPLTYVQRMDGRGKIKLTEIEDLYARYVGPENSQPATLEVTWVVAPIYKEISLVPIVAFFVIFVYLMYLILATLFPKVFAIAHSTFKTEMSQPLFLLVMLIGVLFMVGSIYVPYNTFGEDIKMYKDSGLTLIRVLAIFLAIWAASKSVAEEIEGRTALTVLSKPVGRRQFIFGKFAGISMAVAVMFMILGLWFVIWVAYKPIYDYAEASKGLCEWPVCFLESVNVIPGVFLCFLEVLIFVAISVAISTRFGILANFLICFAVYVLGHLTPLLVQSSYAAFEPVVVFGQLIAIVFPVLNHFDVQAAINTNSPVPLAYMGWSVIYTILYGSMAMLLALVLFEDRDLA
jgi:ABC-type transport system involved in multi-copper enzyme maturation permease subunit